MKIFIIVICVAFVLFSPTVDIHAFMQIDPIGMITKGAKEIFSLAKFFLNMEDETDFFGPKPAAGPPIKNADGCSIDGNNKTEKEYYDIGMEMFNNESWIEAYGNFSALMALHMFAKQRNIKHCIDINDAAAEFTYLIQQAAFKLKRYNEAGFYCVKLLRTHIGLTKSLKERCEKSLEEIELLGVDGVIDEVLADFAEPTPERLAHAAVKLAGIPQYKKCGEENAKKAAKEVATKPYAICRYSNRNRHPLLILSPVKEEVLSLKPVVVFFHDVITKSNAETLKGLSRERLAPSEGSATNMSISEHMRTSKVAFLEGDLFPQLNSRLEAVTGMTGDDEPYQVTHYAVGGHYLPHLDFNRSNTDDRIATLLIYLSNVTVGGRTVFKELGLSVTPETHGALFWYNLHRNETGNNFTLHAECPVMEGEKWTVNKWYRTRAQLFHKPCGLRRSKSSFSLTDFDLDKQFLTALTKEKIRITKPVTKEKLSSEDLPQYRPIT